VAARRWQLPLTATARRANPAAGRGARDCGYGDPAEDRVLRRDPFELLRGCAAADQDARPGPGRALKIAAQDGGVRTRADLLEADDLTVLVPQHGATSA